MTPGRVPLRTLHLFIGALGVLAFLGTGLYMHFPLGHLYGMADFPRALYRSGHIYLLFSALLNLALGLHLVESRFRAQRGLQQIGSAFLLLGPVMFVYGFFVETPLGAIDRPVTALAIIVTAVGLLLHAISVTRQTGAPRQDERDGENF